MLFPTPTKIPHDFCPHCGAISSTVEINSRTRDEKVGYECGFMLQYSPISDALLAIRGCGNSEATKIEAKRQALIRFLRDEVELDTLSISELEKMKEAAAKST